MGDDADNLRFDATSLETGMTTTVLINDDDLLSLAAQRAVERIATPVAALLVVAILLTNLAAPHRRSVVVAGRLIGVLPFSTKWRWRREHRLTASMQKAAEVRAASLGDERIYEWRAEKRTTQQELFGLQSGEAHEPS